MSPSDVTTTPEAMGLHQAEAALVEHYPRLVRLGYLVLPRSLPRHRRVLTAHALAQRALPRGRAAGDEPAPVPAQRVAGPAGREAGYAYLRLRVLRAVLAEGRPARLAGREVRLPKPRLLPLVAGLRLTPRQDGAEDVALDQALGALGPAARAAFALRRLDGLDETAVRGLLRAADVAPEDIGPALAAAATLAAGVGGAAAEPADPCALQARPTDLLRRRRHVRTALIGGAALAVVAGTLAVLPGGWGDDGAAAPPYAQNVAAEAALDPQGLRRIPDTVWRQSARTDFSVWPARGDKLDDTGLLRRALAVWARPGEEVVVSATPGTQTGPPPGPAQLLYAGESSGTSVVLLYDGLRLVRYAEAAGASSGAALLDFARVDGAGPAGAAAVVLTRGDGNTGYLMAPWVTGAATTDLVDPAAGDVPLDVDEAGVTGAVRTTVGQQDAAAQDGLCAEYPALSVTLQGSAEPYVFADLGELVPAQLTSGAPGGPAEAGAAGEGREHWARTACHLPQVSGAGVRAVNLWDFAGQTLPDGAGEARWVCVRAETWRGVGAKTLTEFLPPVTRPGEPGVMTATAEDASACGQRRPAVLSGVLWRSPAEAWYLVAAGSDEVTSIRAEGGVTGEAEGRTLALAAEEGAQAELSGTLGEDGTLAMLGG
ncbi:hypothetical protein [Streptomyces avicenniae]|uniref:hypothetical protein n=1 Tax=Streptomyces avicenniae TaxID=500153 RepID=UPI000A8D9B38|nr:hypothetical protein [Streptomyces avicenniae]